MQTSYAPSGCQPPATSERSPERKTMLGAVKRSGPSLDAVRPCAIAGCPCSAALRVSARSAW